MKSRLHASALIIVFALLLFAPPLHAQTTWYIDDDAPGDPGPGDTSISDPLEDGSAAHPFDAIQEGLDASGYRDTILLRDGTYSGEGNWDVSFRGSRTVTSENGPENCTIDCGGSSSDPHRAFYFGDYFSDGSVVEGLTITGGRSPMSGFQSGGGAIRVYIGSPTIRGNIFIDNGGDLGRSGGAIYCFEDTGAQIIGNTFIGNYSYCAGGAIAYHRAAMVIQDNEFIANVLETTSFEPHGSAIYGWQIDETNRASIVGNTFSGHVIGGVMIFMEAAQADVIGNTFTDNEALCLQFDKSPSLIQSNDFTGNTGGCIYARYDGSGDTYDSSVDVIGNTFTDGSGENGTGVYCLSSNSVIASNVFSGNHASDSGGALYCTGSRSRILGNVIKDNSAGVNGGGMAISMYEGIVAGNRILRNHADGQGGGLYVWGWDKQVVNNLIVENTATGEGGGIAHHADNIDYRLNTISGNQAAIGGGIYLNNNHYWSSSITDSIIWGNTPDQYFLADAPVLAAHCDVQGGAYGEQMINADPRFTTGQSHEYNLSNIAAGQWINSPCIDAGSEPAGDAVIPAGAPASALSTRTDWRGDTGQVDIGYHYPIRRTVSCDITGLPSSGALPFSSQLTMSLTNNYAEQTRRFLYQIDVTLAGGPFFASWRSGWQNVMAGQVYNQAWWQNIPAVGLLLGDTLFQLTAVDVTPSPYNLPPYPPAGATDTGSCTVTGVAP